MTRAPSVPVASRGSRAPGLLAAGGLWLAGAAAGLGVLLVYGNTPGATSQAPPRWPADAGLALDPERPTLVMFAHPRCPCTRASLHELERLAAAAGDRLAVRVLFYAPAAAEDGWERTDLWDLASAIPGARVERDPDGARARRFGALTSGHVAVFGPDQEVAFQGGITAARGHEGDNRGRDAILHLVETGRALERATPVFGCAIAAGGGAP